MTEVKFNLTKSQMRKLAQAHKSGSAVTLRSNKSLVSPTGIPLLLTDTEYKKIQGDNTHDITISSSRVKRGGFLPAILAALPTIASVLGGLSGITGIASNIKQMVGKSLDKSSSSGKLAKILGLGRKRKRGKALYLAP